MKRSTKLFLVLLVLVVAVGAALVGASWLAGRLDHVPGRSVLVVSLDGALPEDDPGEELNRLLGVEVVTLPELVDAVDRAAADERIAAIELRPSLLAIGWGRTQELREALLRFRAAGKPVQALLGMADDQAYYLATAASDVRLARTGALWLDGLRAEVGFYGGPLAKLGIEADLEQIGEYKNSADVMERRDMTEAHRRAMESLIDGLFEEMVRGIADGRGVGPEAVRDWVNAGPYGASRALEAGLVDAISFPDEARDALATAAGVPELEELPLERYVDSARRGRGPLIAVVNCLGTITPGESRQGLLGGRSMGSDTIAAAIRRAHERDGARALVLRVDSPGGSALASDLIGREVERARAAGVPVVVSMADLAASGGYWIAMGADRVLAQPATITGSIGIYGGKYVMKDLHDRLDYGIEPIERGANASFFSSRSRFTPAQRRLLQRQLRETYQLFLEGTASGRGLDGAESVDAVARGRVWTGRQALELGLVDALGGRNEAVRQAKALAGLAEDAPVEVRAYPRPATLGEILTGSRKEARRSIASRDGAGPRALAPPRGDPLARPVRAGRGPGPVRAHRPARATEPPHVDPHARSEALRHAGRRAKKRGLALAGSAPPREDLLPAESRSGTRTIEQMLSRAHAFTEKLLAENARLRKALATSHATMGTPRAAAGAQVRERLEGLEQSLAEARARIQSLQASGSKPGAGAERAERLEAELSELRRRHAELEEQNNNLANLYVASYQLHSTLDFKEVVAIVMEIVINLIGAEVFCIMLLDGKTDELCVIAAEGMERQPTARIPLGEGVIGGAAKTGKAYYREEDEGEEVDFLNPLAAIPLKIKDHVIGVIAVHGLLPQKERFSPVDYELFDMLAGHAATAVFSAKLYSESERKLTTIQSFLDLLTTS
jgi:protease-4